MRLNSILTYLFSLLTIAFLFTSCGDIQQDLYLNADGSGKQEASFDLGEMMSMMKGFGDMGMPDDSTSDDMMPVDTGYTIPPDTAKKDAMQLLIERVTDPAYDHDFDTIINLMDAMPDSLKHKENRPDLLNKIAMHLKSPANSAELVVGLVISYDSYQQLQDVMNHLDTLDKSNEMVPGSIAGGISKKSFMVYDADLKAGWIKIDSTDYSQFGSEFGMSTDSLLGGEDTSMLEMMFGSSKIRSVIHVPGEVTSCTNKDAIITKDDKVIIEYDFLDAFKKGKLPGYTIYFKPKK